MTERTPNPCPHCQALPEIDGFGYYHDGTESHEIRCKNPDCKVKPYIIQTQDEESDFDLVERWNDQDFDEPV
jgi:hypothetical protein